MVSRSLTARERSQRTTAEWKEGPGTADWAAGWFARKTDSELKKFAGLESDADTDILRKNLEKLDKRAASYFSLGISESDQLKKFLYFFLSLEVETHAVFRRVDHVAKTRALVTRGDSGAPLTSTINLLTRDISSWDNLFDRFAWCANCAWIHLLDDDVALFKQLKEARDAIAHGRASEPPAGYARLAELLAHKVLWGQASEA